MRDFLKFIDLVALLLQEVSDAGVFFGGYGRFPRHDPDIVAFGPADHGHRVVVIEIDDPVLGFERPDKLHAPDCVGLGVPYEPSRVVLLERAIRAAFVESECRRNRSVFVQAVGLNGVVGVCFNKGRYVGNDIPISHESLEVDIIDGFDRFHSLASG